MTEKKSIFYLEYKSFFIKRKLFILLPVFILLLAMMQTEIIENKSQRQEIKIANKLENSRAKQFDGYTPYSVYGVTVYGMPAPMNFLSTFKMYSALTAAVDVGIKLIIYQSKKGNNTIPDPAAGYLNFSGLLYLLGSLLVCIYGFGTFDNEKKLKYLCSVRGFKKVLILRPLSRMTLASMTVIILLASAVVLAAVNRIDLIDRRYLAFVFQVLLLMNLFFLTGAAAGSLKHKKIGVPFLAGIFILVNFLAPWIAAKAVKDISPGISEHQTTFDQLKILMAFEKKGINNFADIRSGDGVNEFMKSYLEHDLKILEDIENKHRQAIVERIQKYRDWCLIFPATFYLTSVNEMAGSGFDNYISFYDFAVKTKRQFIEFFFDKEYFSGSEPGKVESFVKGDGNIHYSRGRLPGNFLWGIGLMFIYMVVMTVIAYVNVFKKVYPVKRKLPCEDDLFIHLEKGQKNLLFTGFELLKSKVYNHFSGKEKLKSDISLFTAGPDKDVAEGTIDFVYLVDPGVIDIDTGVLDGFLFGEKKDRNQDKWQVMFRHALGRELIVMDGFLAGLKPDEIDDIMLQIKEKDVYFLLISDDFYFTRALCDNPRHIAYLKSDPTAAPLVRERSEEEKRRRGEEKKGH